MQLNLQMEGANNNIVGSEQASSSEDGQFVAALIRKMVKKEIEVMMIRQGNLVISPITELVRQVVKEETQTAVEVVIEKLLASGNLINASTEVISKERSLILKFFGEVPDAVLTGKELMGKGGTPMRVEIIDEVTGKVVESGPESSAKVEILLLEASENDNNWSHLDFDSRIIKESDKTKPHFAKSYHIYLEKGTGILSNAKLAHDSNWMKSCKCRLGARVNLKGAKVQEAWTEPFMVCDSRSKLYGKHYPPSLSDLVWRLERIGREGGPRKRLNEEKVWTVEDFLFMLLIDSQRLQKITGAGANAWKAIVEHARTCIDARIGVYNDSSECNMSVVFAVVEGLKGVIRDSHYVPYNDLSNDDKDRAQKSLLSAFENREGITYFPDEATFQHHFPYQESYTPMDTSIPEGCDPVIPESTSSCNSTEPGSSSQVISQSVGPADNINNISDWDSLAFKELRRLDSLSLDCCFSNISMFSEDDARNQNLTFLCCLEGSNLHETHVHESQSCQQSNAGSILLVRTDAVMRWVFRARERVVGRRYMHVAKRQKV